jgi:hypothetical protein
MDHVLSSKDPRERLLAASIVENNTHVSSLISLYRIDKVDKGLALVILGWLYRARGILHVHELLKALVVR